MTYEYIYYTIGKEYFYLGGIMKRGLEQWLEIGERRVFSILKKYTVCTEKQFQLKICEAGPYNQRIEPLILDKVGDKLYREEKILSKSISIKNNNIGVFYLKDHDKQIVEKRIENFHSNLFKMKEML